MTAGASTAFCLAVAFTTQKWAPWRTHLLPPRSLVDGEATRHGDILDAAPQQGMGRAQWKRRGPALGKFYVEHPVGGSER